MSDNETIIISKVERLGIELDGHYKDLADLKARMTQQERITAHLITTISDQRQEQRADLTELKRDLSGSMDRLHGSLDELSKAIEVLRISKAESDGGIKLGKWIIETVKLGGVGGLAAWLTSYFGNGGG